MICMESNVKQLVQDLSQLIIQLKYFEAFDKFYDENIVTHENENPPLTGLAAYKDAAKAFLENISNYKAVPKSFIVVDNISVCEWHYIFDHAKFGHWDKVQLSVQRWKDGKIIFERHYYDV